MNPRNYPNFPDGEADIPRAYDALRDAISQDVQNDVRLQPFTPSPEPGTPGTIGLVPTDANDFEYPIRVLTEQGWRGLGAFGDAIAFSDEDEAVTFTLNLALHLGTIPASTLSPSSINSSLDILQVNSANNTTQTLPSTLANKTDQIVVKNIGTGTVTIAAPSGRTLEKPYSIATQFDKLTFYLDGTVWRTK